MRLGFDDVEHLAAEGPDEFAGIESGPMPRIIPEPRYLSMPSVAVGGIVFRNRARNCTPCVRSLAHSPLAWMNLAGGDHRGMTDDGDGFTLAARLHAQNAEAVVFVMKCYTLDEAG